VVLLLLLLLPLPHAELWLRHSVVVVWRAAAYPRGCAHAVPAPNACFPVTKRLPLPHQPVQIQLGAVVDMVINNQDTGEHPLHLHGQW
jgi:hypothetical protein